MYDKSIYESLKDVTKNDLIKRQKKGTPQQIVTPNVNGLFSQTGKENESINELQRDDSFYEDLLKDPKKKDKCFIL